MKTTIKKLHSIHFAYYFTDQSTSTVWGRNQHSWLHSFTRKYNPPLFDHSWHHRICHFRYTLREIFDLPTTKTLRELEDDLQLELPLTLSAIIQKNEILGLPPRLLLTTSSIPTRKEITTITKNYLRPTILFPCIF